MRLLSTVVLTLSVSVASPASALAQDGGLRARFVDLFTFGSGCGATVLFCLKSGGSDQDFAQQAFSANADAFVSELSAFLQGSITLGIATVPAPSAGSGEVFQLNPLGILIRNEEKSLGPLLAERTLTLGRGNVLFGANLTGLRFERLRGVALDELQFNVVQRDLPPTGPPLGDPAIERTYLEITTRLAFEARVANFFLTVGVTDWLDVGVLVPVVEVALSGFSDARIISGEGEDPAAGFSFGGPTEDPKLEERAVLAQQRASGLGDISLRTKVRFTGRDSRVGLGLLAKVRLPTGKEEDFLGSPATTIEGLVIFSVELGAGFTPHINAGGILRNGEGQREAAILTAGFDQRMSNRLTFAAEFLSQFPFGDERFPPTEVVIRDGNGNDTTVPNSNLPALSDRLFDASVGAKFRVGPLQALANVIIPLNDGGLRADVLWTAGLQVTF